MQLCAVCAWRFTNTNTHTQNTCVFGRHTKSGSTTASVSTARTDCRRPACALCYVENVCFTHHTHHL